MFLFIYVYLRYITLYNTLVPKHQFCGKIAHSGHCFVTKCAIFEKHNPHYGKTQQKRSRTTNKLCSMLTVIKA